MFNLFKVVNSSLSGNSPSINVTTVADGGVEYYPIPGDMLRTVSNKPQVRNMFKIFKMIFLTKSENLKLSVIINGIPSKCSTDCSFQWMNSLTPVVDAIDTSK